MADDQFRGTPPESDDEWRKIWRAIYRLEQMMPALEEAMRIINGVAAIRRAMPWIVMVGGVFLAYLNRDALIAAALTGGAAP